MYPITETEKRIRPLSTAISNALLKSVDFALYIVEARSRAKEEKHAQEIATALKIEYPFESEDYIVHLVKTKFIPEKSL